MIEDERSFVTPYYYDPYRSGANNTGDNTQTSPGSNRDMLSAKTSLEISKPKIGLNVYKTDENGSFVLDEFGRRILEKREAYLWKSKSKLKNLMKQMSMFMKDRSCPQKE